MNDPLIGLLKGLRFAAASRAELAKHEARIWHSVSKELERLVTRTATAQSNNLSSVQKKCFTTDEAANYLGISRTALYRCRAQGLRHIKIGKSARYDIGELDRFILSLNRRQHPDDDP